MLHTLFSETKKKLYIQIRILCTSITLNLGSIQIRVFVTIKSSRFYVCWWSQCSYVKIVRYASL